jgi:gamma-glutamylputrescine oxidase
MGAAHLHPLNYALGLAAAAQNLGVKIYENSAVSHYKTGKITEVFTADGLVRANRLVIGCNGYLGNLDAKLVGKIMPINNFIVATEPLNDELAKRVNPQDVAIADSRFVVNYYRLSADKRLLFGGGENYRAAFPKDIAAFVRKPMLKIYPYLKDVKIDYAWGGTLAVTLNRLPHFGTFDNERVLYAQGYSGHGVALASLAGQLIADKISGEEQRFDLMAGLPTGHFPGGKWLRWPGMVAGMAYYAMRDRI